MSSDHASRAAAYKPEPVSVPPLYAWPPRPVAALKYLTVDLIWPTGLLFLGLAFLVWRFLTPSLATMATFEASWIALLWCRNLALYLLIVGGLHVWLHVRPGRTDKYRLNKRKLARKKAAHFFGGNQTLDNMFWSIASGVTVWTAYEAVTYWFYASGSLPVVDNPWYFAGCFYLLFFWSTTNFYFLHRLLHWPPMYRRFHALHHRNVDVGPFSGISMHPVEHLIYFSVFILWWIIPVHPVIIVLTGFYQGISPALSHSGYDYVDVTPKIRIKTGDWFHHQHHRFFEVNYGNTPTPFDKLFGSWQSDSSSTHR